MGTKGDSGNNWGDDKKWEVITRKIGVITAEMGTRGYNDKNGR